MHACNGRSLSSDGGRQCVWPWEVTVRRFAILILAGAGLLAAPGPAAAQAEQPQARPSVRVGGTIFYDYTFTNAPKSTDADGNEYKGSAFDVRRAYINITGSMSPLISFRITPDIRRETSATSSLSGSLNFRVKYAYVQFNLDEWMPSGSRVRLGIHQTPYIESQEGVYRYRFQGTIFAERDGGLSSSDAGVSFRAALPDRYGTVQVGVYNGEGYSRPDNNGKVSVQLIGQVRPFAKSEGVVSGLRTTVFYDHGYYVQDAERRRFIANATFEHRRLNAGFDWVVGRDQLRIISPDIDSTGLSFFVTPFLNEKGKGLEGLLRYDYWTSEAAGVDGSRRRVIIGGAYWFPNTGPAQAALLVDWEQVTRAGSFLSSEQKQQRLAVHGLINF